MFKKIINLNPNNKRFFSSLQSGSRHTTEFKKYLTDDLNNPISFFHDLPLNLNPENKTVTMIVELPRYTQGKFEISKTDLLNPIIQDKKKNKLRFINNIFPFHGYPCNYGSLPQTWEDSTIKSNNLFGDNDPLDVCEIGSSTKPANIGSIKTVKVLGCLGMIDDGEMDWKLISIDINDKLSKNLNDINDIETYLPGLLYNLKKWFKNYKKPMNKPENKFAFNGEWLSTEDSMKIINECHERWELLINDKINPTNGAKLPIITNKTLKATPGFRSVIDIPVEKVGDDHPIPLAAQEIFYYED